MWPILQVWSMPKTKLSCHDLPDWMQFMMKTRQGNDVTDNIGLVYAKNET